MVAEADSLPAHILYFTNLDFFHNFEKTEIQFIQKY